MKKILLYLWQYPQNLVGLIVLLYAKWFGGINRAYTLQDDIKVYYVDKFRGGVSLGKYIFIDSSFLQRRGAVYLRNEKTERHEWGHTRQSLMFGPLYLLVIGFPSVVHCIFHNKEKDYEHFFVESWATKLGKKIRWE